MKKQENNLPAEEAATLEKVGYRVRWYRAQVHQNVCSLPCHQIKSPFLRVGLHLQSSRSSPRCGARKISVGRRLDESTISLLDTRTPVMSVLVRALYLRGTESSFSIGGQTVLFYCSRSRNAALYITPKTAVSASNAKNIVIMLLHPPFTNYSIPRDRSPTHKDLSSSALPSEGYLIPRPYVTRSSCKRLSHRGGVRPSRSRTAIAYP